MEYGYARDTALWFARTMISRSASFEFTSEAEAQAAQKKMQEILATCVKATGYA
jgi:hypothetical protein